MNFGYLDNACLTEPPAYEVSAGAAPLCELMRRYSDAVEASDRAAALARRNARKGLAS